MFRQLLILSALMLTLTGCYPVHREGFEPALANNGFSRINLVLIPAFDSSETPFCWNISDELTQDIRKRLGENEAFYIHKEALTFNRVKAMGHFSLDETLWQIRPIYAHSDFVILLDIVQHDILATEQECCRPCATLMQKLRITIVDVRGHPSKIVLEEIIVSSHTIPCGNIPTREEPNYKETPVGKAHARLAELAAIYIENAVRRLE